jgi:hypothetical protein
MLYLWKQADTLRFRNSFTFAAPVALSFHDHGFQEATSFLGEKAFGDMVLCICCLGPKN